MRAFLRGGALELVLGGARTPSEGAFIRSYVEFSLGIYGDALDQNTPFALVLLWKQTSRRLDTTKKMEKVFSWPPRWILLNRGQGSLVKENYKAISR